jgi:hypothetical protein
VSYKPRGPTCPHSPIHCFYLFFIFEFLSFLVILVSCNRAAKIMEEYDKVNKEPSIWLEDGPAFILPIVFEEFINSDLSFI